MLIIANSANLVKNYHDCIRLLKHLSQIFLCSYVHFEKQPPRIFLVVNKQYYYLCHWNQVAAVTTKLQTHENLHRQRSRLRHRRQTRPDGRFLEYISHRE